MSKSLHFTVCGTRKEKTVCPDFVAPPQASLVCRKAVCSLTTLAKVLCAIYQHMRALCLCENAREMASKRELCVLKPSLSMVMGLGQQV